MLQLKLSVTRSEEEHASTSHIDLILINTKQNLLSLLSYIEMLDSKDSRSKAKNH